MMWKELCFVSPKTKTDHREYQEATGFRVGFKPAGGIRTAKDAIAWLVLIKVFSLHFHMYITGYCFIPHYLGCYIPQVCNTQIAGEYRINCISLLILSSYGLNTLGPLCLWQCLKDGFPYS